MTTPTREQVIQAAQAAGVPDLWLACMTDLAFEYLGKMLEAARAQALDEAAGVCSTERAEFLEQSARNDGRQSDMAFGSVNSSERISAAIQALKGKQ